VYNGHIMTAPPRLSPIARDLLAAVVRDEIAPGQGWGFYLPGTRIDVLWRAKDRLLDLGYVRMGAADEPVLVATAGGEARLDREATTT
jgi:hypothetical protein